MVGNKPMLNGMLVMNLVNQMVETVVTCNIIVICVPFAYGLAYLTQTPDYPHGQPIALFGSLVLSWVLGMVISIIVFAFGKWKKKMLLQH